MFGRRTPDQGALPAVPLLHGFVNLRQSLAHPQRSDTEAVLDEEHRVSMEHRTNRGIADVAVDGDVARVSTLDEQAARGNGLALEQGLERSKRAVVRKDDHHG